MRRMCVTAVILGVGIVAPVAAFAGSAPPRPAAGKWKIVGGGGFKVSHDQQSISGLHLKSHGTHGCGTGQITVLGSQKLSTTSLGGATTWIVGQSAPSTSAGLNLINVKVRQGGHTMAAGMYLRFAVGGDAVHNDGELEVGACLLLFKAKK